MNRLKVGDRVRVNTHSNIGIVECRVREPFMQQIWSYEAPRPAVVLDELSWAYEDDCELVETGASRPPDGD